MVGIEVLSTSEVLVGQAEGVACFQICGTELSEVWAADVQHGLSAVHVHSWRYDNARYRPAHRRNDRCGFEGVIGYCAGQPQCPLHLSRCDREELNVLHLLGRNGEQAG